MYAIEIFLAIDRIDRLCGKKEPAGLKSLHIWQKMTERPIHPLHLGTMDYLRLGFLRSKSESARSLADYPLGLEIEPNYTARRCQYGTNGAEESGEDRLGEISVLLRNRSKLTVLS